MMRIAGSDVVTRKMENTGGVVSEAALDAAREELGLDKPFLTQYFVWLGKLLRGDMGNSYVSGVSVFDTFISKLPATLLLTATSILLTIIISIPLGILSAVKQNTIVDYLIRFCSFIGNSLPNFFAHFSALHFLFDIYLVLSYPSLPVFYFPFSFLALRPFFLHSLLRTSQTYSRIKEPVRQVCEQIHQHINDCHPHNICLNNGQRTDNGKHVTVRVQRFRKSHVKQKLILFSVLAVCLVVLAVLSYPSLPVFYFPFSFLALRP